MNITISIPQEIEVKLRSVENKSGLITNLLKEYFNKEDDPEILKLKREKLKSDMENKLKQLDYEIETKETKIIKEQETEEQRKEKKNNLINNCIKNSKEVFNVEITKEQAEEYLKGDYNDILEYLKIDPIVENDN